MAKRRREQPLPQRKASSQQEAQQGIPRWVWYVGGGVLIVLVVAGLAYLGYGGQNSGFSDIEGLEISPDQSRQHISGDIDYIQMPPAGGAHNPEWLTCGTYEKPVRPENVIHSMEHGAVWIAYQPELPPGQVDVLRQLVRQEQSRRGEPLIVLAPLPGLESPVVATAWRAQLKLENPADERLQAFVDRFQRGPFTPEPGANCAFGGIMP